MHVTIYPKKVMLGLFIIFTLLNILYSYIVLTGNILLSHKSFVIYLALSLVFIILIAWLNRLELNDDFLIIRGDTKRGFKKYPLPLEKLAKVESQVVPIGFGLIKKRYFFVYFNDLVDVKAFKLNEKFYFLKDLEFFFEKVKTKNIPYYKK